MSEEVICSLCRRSVDKNEVFYCHDMGKITYECIDEKSCKRIVKKQHDDKEEEKKKIANAEFMETYGFNPDKLKKCGYGESDLYMYRKKKMFFRKNCFDYRYELVEDNEKLLEEYMPPKTADEFEDRYGFPTDDLVYLVNDCSFRNGGDVVYYVKKDNEFGEYEFYADNNFGSGWRKVKTQDMYDHYYYKYICEDEEKIQEYRDEQKRKIEEIFNKPMSKYEKPEYRPYLNRL